MKPKDEAPKVKAGTPVREKLKTVEPKGEPKAQPVKSATVYRVKCIWSGPVKVAASKTPSGKAYDFQPQQEQGIDNKKDMLYLTSLAKKSTGCCGGGSGDLRHYFELV